MLFEVKLWNCLLIGGKCENAAIKCTYLVNELDSVISLQRLDRHSSGVDQLGQVYGVGRVNSSQINQVLKSLQGKRLVLRTATTEKGILINWFITRIWWSGATWEIQNVSSLLNSVYVCFWISLSICLYLHYYSFFFSVICPTLSCNRCTTVSLGMNKVLSYLLNWHKCYQSRGKKKKKQQNNTNILVCKCSSSVSLHHHVQDFEV